MKSKNCENIFNLSECIKDVGSLEEVLQVKVIQYQQNQYSRLH